MIPIYKNNQIIKGFCYSNLQISDFMGMDKVKILAIIGVVVMLGSMIAPQFLMWGSDSGGENELVVGTTNLNGTLRTYDPILIAPLTHDEQEFQFIRDDEGFKRITQNAEGWVIETKTRDDVYPIATLLKEKNINTTTVGNIVIDSQIEVKLANGSTTTAVNKIGVIKMLMKPLIEEDQEVTVQFLATVQNGFLVNIENAVLVADEISEAVNGTVVKLESITYTYEVPWNQRNEIEGILLEDNKTSYSKNNIVYFEGELTMDEVIERKDLEYLTYIDQYSVGVVENFTDIDRMREDFPETVDFNLPPSTLVLTADEESNLPYELIDTTRTYSIALPKTIKGYSLDKEIYYLETKENYEENQSIAITFEGTAIGNKIVSVNGFRPS